ncbi:MAG TPA: polysaccharide deacetylase family protein [Symbiobacteriaceae bacterium]|nr:polysaccharide deacetylase family protein [Symbiobacteriaceae bacterium]
MWKRRVVIAVVALLLGAGALWPAHKSRTFQFFGEIVARVETDRKVVALTFDDGPIPGRTEEILGILRELSVPATFFVTGRELEEHMTQGKQLVAGGHELGNHSYSHARTLALRSVEAFGAEIERTDALIREAGYQGEIHFRPPYGKKLFTGPWYLSRTGRKTITWDVEPESYPEVAVSAERIAGHVQQNARPGSIILLHVMYGSRAESVRAVRPIVEGLRAEGYRFVTVSELLAR